MMVYLSSHHRTAFIRPRAPSFSIRRRMGRAMPIGEDYLLRRAICYGKRSGRRGCCINPPRAIRRVRSGEEGRTPLGTLPTMIQRIQGIQHILGSCIRHIHQNHSISEVEDLGTVNSSSKLVGQGTDVNERREN